MKKKGKVLFHEMHVGHVWQDENGYWFQYNEEYKQNPVYGPISQTFPLGVNIYNDKKSMFSFFDGLIPEGWLLDIAAKNWKINEKDRMELLLTVCKDCIGAVSIVRES